MSSRITGRWTTVLLGALTIAACSDNPQKVKQDAVARGDQFAKDNKYGEAIIEYRRAIQADAQFGEGHLKLADTLLKNEDVIGAIREYIRAADLLPNDVDLQVKVGNMLLAAGRFDDARVRAEKALEKNSKNGPALVLRGNAMAGLKDLDAALSDMETALASDPGKATTYANLGLLQSLRGDAGKAEEAFTTAIQTDGANVQVRLAYANFLLAAKRPADAEIQLKEAYSRDRKNILVNRALAVFYATQNKPKDAEQYLRSLADEQGDTQAQFALVQLYAATGRRGDADKVLAGLKARRETSLDATLIMARLAYADKETARAYALVKEVLDSSPKESKALLLKSQIDLNEKRFADAISSAKAALAAEPNLPDAHIVQGEALRQQRDLDGAKAAFNEALRMRPADPAIQIALSQLNLATGGVETARQLAQSALTTAPQAPVARVAVVRAAIAANDLTRADTELASLAKQYPTVPQVLALQGTLSLAKKNWAAAERFYKQAEGATPGSLEIATGLTYIELNTNRAAAARARVEKLVAGDPKNVDFLLLAARTYASLKDIDKSEETLRDAVDADPGRTEPYALLASLYVQQSKLDRALQEFQTLSTKQPKSVGVKTMIAAIYQTQNKRSEAQKAYREALALDSSAAVANNNLAWMIAEDNGNLDEALQLAQAARAKLPTSADVSDTIGWIYYKKGLHAQAVDAFKESVSKQPDAAAFQYHLGLASAKAGQYTQARQALETALKLDPKSSDATEARQALSKLSAFGS